MTFAQPQVQIRPICSNVMNYSPRSAPLLFGTSHECLGLVCARALCRTRALTEQKMLAKTVQCTDHNISTVQSMSQGRLATTRAAAKLLIQYVKLIPGSPYDHSLRACSRAVMLGSKPAPRAAAL